MGPRLLPLLVLVLLQWIHRPGSGAQELPREELLSWVSGRLLEGLGLEGPPEVRGPDLRTGWRERSGLLQQRGHRLRRRSGENRETEEIILFPRTDLPCDEPTNHALTFHFRPSPKHQESEVASARFWFHAGANASSPLFLLTPSRHLQAPSHLTSDGWTTFDLNPTLLTSMTRGPFSLQVRCPSCGLRLDDTPFLHLRTRPAAARSRRHAPLRLPWSPAAIDGLQHPPPQETEEHGDCLREHVEISFQELGWDNWIVHPATLDFYYCRGNCTAPGRTPAALGMRQCCAPAPGSLRSLRITTTSDGGYSFKYETLPNIIPEVCTCV